jgi:GNAT superfamily N-acetyltransferase
MTRWLYKGSVALGVAGLGAVGLYFLLRDSDGGETERAQGPVAAPASDAPYEPFRPGGFPLPRECEPRKIAPVVLEFLDDLNRGDGEAMRFIADEPEFSGWSVGERGVERISVKAPNEKLFGYLRRRHEQGERLGRLEMAVSPARRTTGVGPFSVPGKDPIAAFDFELSRMASDLRERGIQSQLGSGKAGINCRTGRIFLWAQVWGDTPPHRQTCPNAAVEPSWSSAVTCAPGYRRVNEAVEVRLPSQPAS